MNEVPVPLDRSEPTTITELENALVVLRKTVDEVAVMKPGVQKATVVSGLYRAFQELTKELRDMREFALLDAAVELAQEDGEGGRRDVRFFERSDTEQFPYELYRGFKKLYRVNKTIWMDLPNGKRQTLYLFSSDYEPGRIAHRAWKRVFNALLGQRQWEKKFGRPSPHPQYPQYENR
jgi:hypothetical protein